MIFFFWNKLDLNIKKKKKIKIMIFFHFYLFLYSQFLKKLDQKKVNCFNFLN